MKKKIIYLALILLPGAILISSCGSKSNTYNNPTSTDNGTPVAAASITIQNFAFAPTTIHLKVGGTVTWTNKDATAHTVTELNGAFDSGNIDVDRTFKFTFPTAGTYTYHCTIHPMMANATIIVQ